MEALTASLTPKDIALKDIFLDPNNPRFVGQDWSYVSDEDAHQEHHQANALAKLIKSYSIDKLRTNMEINGYLPIDRIVVQSIGGGKFKVLEGNRRVAAAKTISDFTALGNKVDPSVVRSVEIIPCLEYTGDDSNAAWVLQGLRHITGINDWSSYNKARLLVEQMESEGLSLTDVGQRFGLSSFGAGQWVRGYKAYNQATNDTDYTVEIDERIYPYFQELFGRSSIKLKDWLDWDDRDFVFKRKDRLNEYVSWFYPREKDNDGNPDEPSSLGDWEKRVIGKRDDMRQMAYLIEFSPKHFELFRQENDLESAYAQAKVDELESQKLSNEDAEKLVMDSAAECLKAIKSTPISIIKDDEKRRKFYKIIDKLSDAIEWVKS